MFGIFTTAFKAKFPQAPPSFYSRSVSSCRLPYLLFFLFVARQICFLCSDVRRLEHELEHQNKAIAGKELKY